MPKSVDQGLEDLDALQAQPDASVRSAGIKTALRDRHRRVVARATNLAAESLLYELMPDLLAAHQRFLDRPVKTDPNCSSVDSNRCAGRVGERGSLPGTLSMMTPPQLSLFLL